jgi:hypothetical protein
VFKYPIPPGAFEGYYLARRSDRAVIVTDQVYTYQKKVVNEGEFLSRTGVIKIQDKYYRLNLKPVKVFGDVPESSQPDLEKLKAAANELNLYFTSLNEHPVTKAWIKKEDWDNLYEQVKAL